MRSKCESTPASIFLSRCRIAKSAQLLPVVRLGLGLGLGFGFGLESGAEFRLGPRLGLGLGLECAALAAEAAELAAAVVSAAAAATQLKLDVREDGDRVAEARLYMVSRQ